MADERRLKVVTRLKAKRLEAGLSQSQLAEKADIPFRTLQCFEQGAKPIEQARLSTILKAAIALNCKIEDIIDSQDILELLAVYEKRR